jgi:hypothetical protein
LLQHLGLNTLVITDIDAKEGLTGQSAIPKRGQGLKARNETLKTWIPAEASYDVLLDKKSDELALKDPSGYAIRVAYQQPILVTFKSQQPIEALANTFEDALVYENLAVFEKMKGTGLIAKFRNAIAASADLDQLAQAASEALRGGGKAEFALDLLYSDDIDNIRVPSYIHAGLLWLTEQLKRQEQEVVSSAVAA